MLLAGDVGGTKTKLGLFDRAKARPRPVVVRTFVTVEYADLPSMISGFLADSPRSGAIEAACFGVAGPIVGDRAELTNIRWAVDARRVADAFEIPHAGLLND